ncbi:MAG: trimeric intracellular cation channel family protein [Gammaproteobacteria bacterium]|nr:trimeric intracellular cation channel family protein [Gammaproteobacteria bacterium]
MIHAFDLLGVAVFAISGALAAGQKGLDWVGVVALAVVTSIGGGTLRDVLLNRDAVFWIADPTYLWVILGAAVVTIVHVRFLPVPANALRIADALGLALFSVLGAQIAEAEGASVVVVIVMGILTGVAGGIIRDVLIREVPLVFRPTEELYSVAALGGVLCYLLLKTLAVPASVAAIFGIMLVAGLRLAAVIWKIRLPAFHVSVD